MKKLNLLLFLLPQIVLAQNYLRQADSCLELKNYPCAAANYDLHLEKVDSSSNGIAYFSAIAWAKAYEKERTIAAIKVYVRNNALNNNLFFSDKMLREKSFDFLHSDARWTDIITAVQKREAILRKQQQDKVDSAIAFQHQLESHPIQINNTGSASDVYKRIRQYNNFQPIGKRNFSMVFKIIDSLQTSYLVCMPPSYDPSKSYAIMFFLHGAVSMNTGYPAYADTTFLMGGWNRFYTKYAPQHDVIMVYPSGNKDYNWMYPDAGFYMIPAMLKNLKKFINIDDNRVSITGHSNGATGSFSYLIKQPSPFAAFYGFNTRPRIETGGTYIRNILNRSYFNVSTDQDYYYPPGANDTFDVAMKCIGADYQDHRFNGFPHWFPQFDESEPAYAMLFADLDKRRRDPFSHTIQWECDNVQYGRCDWLAIIALDTFRQRPAWHTNINFGIHKWLVLDNKGKENEHDTLLQAFKYPKRSGAIKATYAGNKFIIETSGVKSFSIYISPEMVDFDKPLIVTVNGEQYFHQKVKYDKEFMLAEFQQTADRKAVWVNHVDINLL